jgi:hypothetical protein
MNYVQPIKTKAKIDEIEIILRIGMESIELCTL